MTEHSGYDEEIQAYDDDEAHHDQQQWMAGGRFQPFDVKYETKSYVVYSVKKQPDHWPYEARKYYLEGLTGKQRKSRLRSLRNFLETLRHYGMRYWKFDRTEVLESIVIVHQTKTNMVETEIEGELELTEAHIVSRLNKNYLVLESFFRPQTKRTSAQIDKNNDEPIQLSTQSSLVATTNDDITNCKSVQTKESSNTSVYPENFCDFSQSTPRSKARKRVRRILASSYNRFACLQEISGISPEYERPRSILGSSAETVDHTGFNIAETKGINIEKSFLITPGAESHITAQHDLLLRSLTLPPSRNNGEGGGPRKGNLTQRSIGLKSNYSKQPSQGCGRKNEKNASKKFRSPIADSSSLKMTPEERAELKRQKQWARRRRARGTCPSLKCPGIKKVFACAHTSVNYYMCDGCDKSYKTATLTQCDLRDPATGEVFRQLIYEWLDAPCRLDCPRLEREEVDSWRDCEEIWWDDRYWEYVNLQCKDLRTRHVSIWH
ncbi:MAG: hypothetical protein M1821_005612 [Bathelium mastoideum]|nr:MAG: hypothetical protein M1821_005612 [Bathelium mastoideum]